MGEKRIIGLDVGRRSAKIAGAENYTDQYETFIGEARYLRNERLLNKGDNVFAIWDGKSYEETLPDDPIARGFTILADAKHQQETGRNLIEQKKAFPHQSFIGGIAKEESQHVRQAFQISKCNMDNKLMTLCGVARAIKAGAIDDVNDIFALVSQPIGCHTDNEKANLKKLLLGSYSVYHNGSTLDFTITRVEVGAEGAVSKWGINPAPTGDSFHIIDVGSSTFNIATYIRGKWIDKYSLTHFQGAETVAFNPHSMASVISSEFYKKIRQQFGGIQLIGGVANELKPFLDQHFWGVEVPENPLFTTAKALYEVGVKKSAQTSS